MKIMLRKSPEGAFSVYVPKKDLEEMVVTSEKVGLWGGTVTLSNGLVLALPEMPEEVRFPVTVEARKVGGSL